MEKSDASLNCVNYVVSFPIISTANCFAQERVLILKIPQLPVCIFKVTVHLHNTLKTVSAGSPSRGGNVMVYVLDINNRACRLFLFCSYVCFCLYGPFNLFNCVNSPDISPLSHPVLPVLFLPHGSFQLCICLRKPPPALIKSFVVDWT